ncbi:hypothetical protein GGP41_008338 [Bipolaris sorokiniana]|uniref:chitinase n=1 Tax=Cochliobolus sativus TaxID=45130 RepID=A0A8H5ZPV6_COCSA|nr:hypothetical protein GGP41_008338 [Bipolaris sorokiniana]
MPKTSAKIFSEITAVKQKAPGLKIWISLGGWTFSDNDTDTQSVWGDIARTQANRNKFTVNLYKFMKTYGFDGVDIDWEYPGAPDRGGKPDDVQNFVLLMEYISVYFEASASGFGLSFTAPSSYWYLRWFKIDQLHKYVSWINVMTYDIHGSWDSPASTIGSIVYAHTNLTEIQDTLNLFWRNNVPADKLNLGIGFYGRSYTLEDSSCTKPGCPFSAPGRAGSCTGESGVLSYAEIEARIKMYDLDAIHDKTAGVKYLTFDENQWVSYDDQETLQTKVDFANEQGLLGLFVWAIDLDDTQHTALKALLGGKLGTFATQNGYDPNYSQDDDWDSVTGNSCTWSDCNKSCGPGTRSAGAEQYCGVDKDGKAQPRRTPKLVSGLEEEVDSNAIALVTLAQFLLLPAVNRTLAGHTNRVSSDSERPIDDVCGWTTECVSLKNGKPKDGVCGDRNFVTTKQGTCKGGKGVSYCCDKGIDSSSCHWNEGTTDFLSYAPACNGASQCPEGETRIALDPEGGPDANGNTHSCKVAGSSGGSVPTPWFNVDLAFCCKGSAMGALRNLFPKPGPESDTEKLDIKLDRTMGGQKKAGNSVHPNDSAFGFYIMSGPEEELTSIDKRDGSHWELFDCDNTVGEKRQTVKAVCANLSDDHNCDVIFKGTGVAGTVVDMPGDCGPGRYAVAVSMTPSTDHSHLHKHLVKRGLEAARVFDFTFDYDYSPIEKRADKSNVLLRIDYSDDPGYWDTIVAAKHDSRKRSLEIENDFGGDRKAWLEHTWRKEKREFHHTELHARWWSGDVREWFDKHKKVDETYTGVRHRIADTISVPIFDQDLNCPSLQGMGVDELYFKAWAELNIDIQTAAGVTVIGTLGDLKSFEESSVWFRTNGRVDASLNFNAKGALSFHTGQVELFGAHNFGASFRVPGIVTIGPDFRILASIAGDATLELNTKYAVNFGNWDYAMRYPTPQGESDTPTKTGDLKEPQISNSTDPFSWTLDANGQITAHIIPKVTFGIVFDNSAISNAALDLGVDAYARLAGTSTVGSNQNFKYCYEADAGATLFASVQAPTIFGQSLSRYYALWADTYPIITRKCNID